MTQVVVAVLWNVEPGIVCLCIGCVEAKADGYAEPMMHLDCTPLKASTRFPSPISGTRCYAAMKSNTEW